MFEAVFGVMLFFWVVGVVLVGAVLSVVAVWLKRKMTPKVFNATLDFLIGS